MGDHVLQLQGAAPRGEIVRNLERTGRPRHHGLEKKQKTADPKVGSLGSPLKKTS